MFVSPVLNGCPHGVPIYATGGIETGTIVIDTDVAARAHAAPVSALGPALARLADGARRRKWQCDMMRTTRCSAGGALIVASSHRGTHGVRV